MNGKFHPAAEAVTTCATCGTGMCSQCENGAFFYTEDDKPLCLECSLKEAESNLMQKKDIQKDELKIGIIASIIWIVGVCLLSVTNGFSVLIMLGAAIFYSGKTLFTSEERSFFEKIREIFWQIIAVILLLPIFIITLIIRYKIEEIKANRKVNKIKAAMGNAN